MVVEPNNEWNWHFYSDRTKLVLNLHSNNCFLTSYGKKEIPNIEQIHHAKINVDDSTLFYVVFRCISDLAYSISERVQIALNAMTAVKFIDLDNIPTPQHARHMLALTREPNQGEVFSVIPTNATINEVGDVLVLKVGQGKSLCMVLGTGLIDGDDFYSFLDLVTVDHECLMPLYKMNDEILQELQA